MSEITPSTQPTEVERIPSDEALCCISCGVPSTVRPLDRSHVISRARDPSRVDDPSNIVRQCRLCHDKIERKYARHRVEGGVYIHEAWSNEDAAFVETCRVAVVVDKKRGHLVPLEAESSAVEADKSAAARKALAGADTGLEPRTSVPSQADDNRGSSAAPPPASKAESAAAESGGTLHTGLDPGPVSAAAPSASVLEEDWSGLSDDDLERRFLVADQTQGLAFLVKCKSIDAYRENHVQAWGESWIEQAYQRFHFGRRKLQAYANIWVISAPWRTSLDVAQITPLTDSAGLMKFIGEKSVEDGTAAMEAAVAYQAEFGEPPTPAALAHRLGEEREGIEYRYRCPGCGRKGEQHDFRERVA